MGGVVNDAPPTNKTDREFYFDIVNVLCNRFIGLSPIEVVNADLETIYNLYADVVIHDIREKQGNQQDVYVTSQNATWH